MMQESIEPGSKGSYLVTAWMVAGVMQLPAFYGTKNPSQIVCVGTWHCVSVSH